MRSLGDHPRGGGTHAAGWDRWAIDGIEEAKKPWKISADKEQCAAFLIAVWARLEHLRQMNASGDNRQTTNRGLVEAPYG